MSAGGVSEKSLFAAALSAPIVPVASDQTLPASTTFAFGWFCPSRLSRIANASAGRSPVSS
ncbi:hypothetical protein D3C83_260360 [compost metagenome]